MHLSDCERWSSPAGLGRELIEYLLLSTDGDVVIFSRDDYRKATPERELHARVRTSEQMRRLSFLYEVKTVEDTGLVLGQALDQALADRAGIARFGDATVPMDEARASCSIDISGRPFTLFEADLPGGSTGGFDHELTEEFFRALANAAKLTLHLRVESGSNAHHMIEAAFKAFARALRQAVAIDPTETGVPSTKGTLTA